MINNRIQLILVRLLILCILTSTSESIFLPIAQAGGGGGSQPELGIVAYISLGQNIDLDQARTLFNTIDYENTDEIVGTYSFYIDNYNIEMMNLYITSNGFISTYYMREDPVSKMISWNGDKTIFSKFATVITYVGQSLGHNIDYRNIKYYDYRYPDANRMLIMTQSVGESYIGDYDYGNLKFNIPSYTTIYETSYSLYLKDDYNSQPGSNVAIDNDIIDSIAGNGVIYNFYYGHIPLDTDHLLGIMSNQGAQSGVTMIIMYRDDNDDSQNNPTITVSDADNSFDGTLEDPEYSGQMAPTYAPSYTESPTPMPTPRRTPRITIPMPTVEITEVLEDTTPVQTTQAPLRPSSASVNLYGEKTNVELGENILLKLSAVSLITKPKMKVQVIIIPPSGMSVTSSEFVKSGAGQFTTTYELEPGNGRDIEVRIQSNQIGDFKVAGRIVYYFGDDVNSGEDHTQELSIKVREKDSDDSDNSNNQRTQPGNTPIKDDPGFEIIFGIGTFILLILLLKRKK